MARHLFLGDTVTVALDDLTLKPFKDCPTALYALDEVDVTLRRIFEMTATSIFYS